MSLDIIYELHVRDFTRDASSGVRHDWRGRYLGLTQRGTVLPGTQLPTGLDHLIELGINVVQLMPVHSFALPYSPDYEWGYMPMDYNAPHEGYAAGVEIEAPLRDFKRLVSALHEAGLRVTLDVVYNHTFERWPGSKGADTHGAPAPARFRSFMALAPTEYFRFLADGKPSDGSACGNEFRSDSPMGRRFLVESVKYWVHEFGIDGYRFDLMGLIDTTTMELITKELHAIDPTIMVYGEPWAGGPTPIEVNTKGNQKGKGWGVFNDEFRDALRGSVFKPEEPGFLATGGRAQASHDSITELVLAGDGHTTVERVKLGIMGSIHSFADSPLETINYIECHDNHTLRDRLALSTKSNNHVSAADRERMNKLGALMLLTAQGTPFLHSGQELGRSKGGYDNTYNLGDEINNIPWSLKDQHHRLFDFYTRAIALRKAHPMFRLASRQDVEKAVTFLENNPKTGVPEGVVGCTVTDVTGRDEWAQALLLFNGSGKRMTIPVPPPAAAGGRSSWKAIVDDGAFSTLPPEKRSPITRSIELGPHAGAVLYTDR